MPALLPFLRSLADPTRLRLLLLLRLQELAVTELTDILGMGQSRISSHLAQMRRAGLVEDRRSGKNIYYRLGSAPAPSANLLEDILRAGEAEAPEAAGDRAALDLVLHKRADRAQEYFNQLAGKFGRSYVPGRSWQGLAHLLLRLLPPGLRVADLGAGEGTLAQLLARSVREVIAVDSSPRMVEFGAELAVRHGFANLHYRLGDIEAPPVGDGEVDLALLSQSLHHAVRPERAVREARRILVPGGRVMILDLLSHTFEQARDLYADLWLGFSEAELHRMLAAAGFVDISVSVVAREKSSPHFQTVLATGLKPNSPEQAAPPLG